MKNILILGAGTAGTLIANLLVKKLQPADWTITVIDRAAEHIYQPGLLFLPFKLYNYTRRSDLIRPISRLLPKQVRFIQSEINAIDPERRQVRAGDSTFEYDWLVLALGCRINMDEIPGLTEAFTAHQAYSFYTLDGALQMQSALENFTHGRLVINIAEMPIKCPVAPIEFAFLADYYFTRSNRRKDISITFVTPLPSAFTKPVATEVMTRIAQRKNIEIISNFALERVDGENHALYAFDGRRLDYDLLCVIPPNSGPEVFIQSGLADVNGYALTDPRTLKSRKSDNIYVIGDNANVPTSKAGSVAHFQAEVLVRNLLRAIAGHKPMPAFDGHANCFVETGFHQALLLDFNYDIEPLPGKFPAPIIGPLTLLKETFFNHWGKILFKYVYWNLLLPGYLEYAPLLSSHLSFLGKDITRAPQVRRAHTTIVRNFMVSPVITITQGRPLSEAANLLIKHRISALPVLDIDERLAGMLTEADFLSALDIRHPHRKKTLGTIVDDLMTIHPITLFEEDTLETAIEIMENKRVKQLIVIDDDSRVRGIVTRGDLVKLFAT